MIDIPENKIQERILSLISNNPGISLTKISEILKIPLSVIDRQLQDMRRKKLLLVDNHENFKRYYINNYQSGTLIKLRDQGTQEIQQKILELVTKNPGLHMSKIANIIGISNQLADYHIFRLEKENKIIGLKDGSGYYKRYYLPDTGITNFEKIILRMLRKKIPLEIVICLIKHDNMKHKEIKNHLKISSSLLSYHLSNLVKSGILSVNLHGTDKGYYIVNKREIIRIIKKYNVKIEINNRIEEFKDLWDNLNY